MDFAAAIDAIGGIQTRLQAEEGKGEVSMNRFTKRVTAIGRKPAGDVDGEDGSTRTLAVLIGGNDGFCEFTRRRAFETNAKDAVNDQAKCRKLRARRAFSGNDPVGFKVSGMRFPGSRISELLFAQRPHQHRDFFRMQYLCRDPGIAAVVAGPGKDQHAFFCFSFYHCLGRELSNCLAGALHQ